MKYIAYFCDCASTASRGQEEDTFFQEEIEAATPEEAMVDVLYDYLDRDDVDEENPEEDLDNQDGTSGDTVCYGIQDEDGELVWDWDWGEWEELRYSVENDYDDVMSATYSEDVEDAILNGRPFDLASFNAMIDYDPLPEMMDDALFDASSDFDYDPGAKEHFDAFMDHLNTLVRDSGYADDYKEEARRWFEQNRLNYAFGI